MRAESTDRRGEVMRLRARLERVQGRALDAPVLPVSAPLAALLPGGGLRPGGVYALSPSASLLFALIASASRAGSWCAAVGMPGLGAEAAEAAGVDLSRFVLVPEPGARWLAVTATVAEVLPVVAVRPSSRVSDADVSRLGARLRDRGSVLLVQGRWPQAEATIHVETSGWKGLGRGHGLLARREVTVTVASRRLPAPRRGRMLLPADGGRVEAAHSPPSSGEPGASTDVLEAVG